MSVPLALSPGICTPAPQLKYSVIVVSNNEIVAAWFGSRDRACAYSTNEEAVVTSYQATSFDDLNDKKHHKGTTPPFFVGHPEGMDRRIRIVVTIESQHERLSENEVR